MQTALNYNASVYKAEVLRRLLCSFQHVLIHAFITNSCECIGVNGEALQPHAVYKKLFFYYKLCKNPIRYYKSRALCLSV